MYRSVFKRFFDILIAFTGIVLLLPVMSLVLLILALLNKGTPFFIQERPGKDEVVFNVIKLKTMTNEKDKKGVILSDAERLTNFGRIIRKTSLDETPQLINVLMGSMSLVGPRPLLKRYLPYYSINERVRHNVRPGITGWAQINGRNLVGWDERLKFDMFYIENFNFILDMKILIRTFNKVFSSSNLVVDPQSVMNDLDYERRTK